MKDRNKKYIIPSCKEEDAKRNLSEIDYKNFMNSLPDIVYKIDPNGCFVYVNNAINDLGYTPDELIGKHFSCIIHPDDALNVSREKVLSKFAKNPSKLKCPPKLFDERRTGERMTKDLEVRLLKKGTKESLDTSVHAFGDIRYIEHFEAMPNTKSVKFTGTVGIIRDITERKQMEKTICTIKNAVSGGKPSIVTNMLQYKTQENNTLTAREKEVLILIATGSTNKEIAKNLSISAKTVETHRARIMNKLSIHKAADLVRYAIKSKLLEG